MDINNSAYKILKQFYKGKTINTATPNYEDDIQFLLENNCIKEISSQYSPTYVVLKTSLRITPYGKAVIETKRRMMLKHWIPYIITTAISLIGLYNSIIARLMS